MEHTARSTAITNIINTLDETLDVLSCKLSDLRDASAVFEALAEGKAVSDADLHEAYDVVSDLTYALDISGDVDWSDTLAQANTVVGADTVARWDAQQQYESDLSWMTWNGANPERAAAALEVAERIRTALGNPLVTPVRDGSYLYPAQQQFMVRSYAE